MYIVVNHKKARRDMHYQSLSQIETLEKIAKRDGCVLTKPYYLESQSAKKPGRPIFNKMLQDMEKCRLIECWFGIQIDYQEIRLTQVK